MQPSSPTESRRRYSSVLVVLLCLNFGVLFFDRNALNFLMPLVKPDLQLSNTEVGLLAAAFSLTWAIAGMAIGHVSDRSGRRKSLLLAATLVYALCSGLSGLVSSFVMLFCVRLLMGVAEGGILPISQALTVVEVSPQRRGLAMGFMQNFGSNLLGSTAASLILVPFAAAYGWCSAFYLAALPGVVCAALIAWLIREPVASSPTEVRMHASRATFMQVMQSRNIALCVLISVVMVSHLVICFAFLPLFLVQRGFAGDTMALLLGVLGVAAAFAGFIAPGLSDRVGRKPIMVLLPLLGIVLPLSALFFNGSVWLLGLLFFIGWTVIGTFPLFMATIPSETVDTRLLATTLGLIMGMGEGVGGVISPTLAGYAADRFGLVAPLWIMCVLPLLASALALGLRETAPHKLAATPTRINHAVNTTLPVKGERHA
ncbi:MAG: MFS transporter [Steroidobacteraceae bacterium]